jgi:hypothetical protein
MNPTNPLVQDFLISAENFIRWRLPRILEKSDMSLFNDMKYGFKDSTSNELESYKKESLSLINQWLQNEHIEIKFFEINIDETAPNYADGDIKFVIGFQLERLFDEFEEGFMLPFYTFANTQLIYNAYQAFSDEDLIAQGKNLMLGDDFDDALFNRTNPELLQEVMNNLNGELYREILNSDNDD